MEFWGAGMPFLLFNVSYHQHSTMKNNKGKILFGKSFFLIITFSTSTLCNNRTTKDCCVLAFLWLFMFVQLFFFCFLFFFWK
ncbi:hypothetical protein QBC41DRAFT_319116 [Cercophora samala]|uniref:Uncharacterized protein n=1 Tax=Cercophora samala TaxID=330535 RepID=A0AA39ZEV7_9PEZI|nr:hypothetical protein QBC41DRAFT_319116 [Cercophora samala]